MVSGLNVLQIILTLVQEGGGGGGGGHFHVGLHRMCCFSGCHFSVKIPEPAKNLQINSNGWVQFL